MFPYFTRSWHLYAKKEHIQIHVKKKKIGNYRALRVMVNVPVGITPNYTQKNIIKRDVLIDLSLRTIIIVEKCHQITAGCEYWFLYW